eukprot:5118442-Heterocapsa_arctica.AAC.1
MSDGSPRPPVADGVFLRSRRGAARTSRSGWPCGGLAAAEAAQGAGSAGRADARKLGSAGRAEARRLGSAGRAEARRAVSWISSSSLSTTRP